MNVGRNRESNEGEALVGKRGKRRVGLRRKADRGKAGKIE
jgi:hypothetical protein